MKLLLLFFPWSYDIHNAAPARFPPARSNAAFSTFASCISWPLQLQNRLHRNADDEDIADELDLAAG